MRLKIFALLAAATAAFCSVSGNAQAAPAGDAAIGAKLFLQCKACHTTEPGGKNLVGPNLSGIMGSRSAQVPNYVFSPAMQKSEISWTVATMDAWLKRPSAVVPGTKMVFAGMANPKQRADVIAYLQTLKKK